MDQTPNQNPNQQPQPNQIDAGSPIPTIPEKKAPGELPAAKEGTAPPEPAVNQPKPAPPYAHDVADALEPVDETLYESADGQFRVKQLVRTAKKFPPGKYACIVLECEPQEHTRIRHIDGGLLEIMPTFAEMDALIDSMNSAAMASGKGPLYQILHRVPEKTAAHKARWRRFNEARVRRNRKGKKPGCK
jgi:hypothetical protein